MSDAFSAKDFVEPKTGKTHRVYAYKRRPCHRVVLTSRPSSHLAGYTLIEKDLRSVHIWFSEIDKLHVERPTHKGEHFAKSIDRSNYNLVKGLFVAALTFYGKCFSKCDGRPVKLERVQLDPRFHEIHDECIEYRHNFAAHSGAKKLEYVDVALVYPLKYKTEVPFKLYREIHQPDLFWPREGQVTFLELIEHVQKIALAKIDLLTQKIEHEEVLTNQNRFWPSV